jgi:hypothetical protein
MHELREMAHSTPDVGDVILIGSFDEVERRN